MPSIQYIRLKVGNYDKKSTLSIQAITAAPVSKLTQAESRRIGPVFSSVEKAKDFLSRN